MHELGAELASVAGAQPERLVSFTFEKRCIRGRIPVP
jgi:hypothetical protein